MTYPTEGGPSSRFVTAPIKSVDLAELLNELVSVYGTNWDLVHISPMDSGYVLHVTYRVDQPKDNPPAQPVDDWENQNPSVRYI